MEEESVEPRKDVLRFECSLDVEPYRAPADIGLLRRV